MNRLIIGMIFCLGSQAAVAIENDAISEWAHIAQSARNVVGDAQFQYAVSEAIDAVEFAAIVGSQKLASELSDSEKEKVIELITIVRAMFKHYTAAVMAGNTDHYVDLDQATQDKINALGNRLIMVIMPLLILSQDPAFAQANQRGTRAIRARLFQVIDRTIDAVAQELEIEQLGQ